jgi:hypothetical protein
MRVGKYEIAPLDDAALRYVWSIMRERDRAELQAQGVYQRDRYRDGWSVSVDGVPMICMGVVTYPAALFIWLFATDELRRHVVRLTQYAPGFFDFLRSLHGDRACLVEVWSKQVESVRWLEHLGFECVRKTYRLGEQFKIMELR